jgi:stress response protein SCP2
MKLVDDRSHDRLLCAEFYHSQKNEIRLSINVMILSKQKKLREKGFSNYYNQLKTTEM